MPCRCQPRSVSSRTDATPAPRLLPSASFSQAECLSEDQTSVPVIDLNPLRTNPPPPWSFPTNNPKEKERALVYMERDMNFRRRVAVPPSQLSRGSVMRWTAEPVPAGVARPAPRPLHREGREEEDLANRCHRRYERERGGDPVGVVSPLRARARGNVSRRGRGTGTGGTVRRGTASVRGRARRSLMYSRDRRLSPPLDVCRNAPTGRRSCDPSFSSDGGAGTGTSRHAQRAASD